MVNDEPRWESRVPWWRENCEEVLCVVGHYWRVALPGESKYESLFDGLALEAVHGSVMCIDYSVGKRFRERMQHGHNGRYHSRLGALRLPEQFVFYDNAEAVGLLR